MPSGLSRARIVLAIGLIAGLVAGCESNKNKDLKRAEDRAAIQLSQAQRDREEYKAQAEKLHADLADAQGRLTLAQQQVEALRGDLNKALDASAQAQKAQADAQKAQTDAIQKAAAQAQQAVADLTRQVQTAQVELQRVAAENQDLTRKLADARAATAVKAAAPTTAPNKD
jgi:chromosome segregation ATPase